jgi:orotidine-5'-phosphate decarboxylase
MIAWRSEGESVTTPGRGNPLVLPLDLADPASAVASVRELREEVGAFKIGLELFHAAGPAIFGDLREAGAERLFYDGKLCDIPNTVAGAARSIGGWGVWMVTVHTLGGLRMMRAAREALHEGAARAGVPPPLVVGVTLLTSLDEAEVRDEVGLMGSMAGHIVRLAAMARQAGLDGAVCSPHEATAIRSECGPEFVIVTPGIRPAGAAARDQRRVATPAQALAAGADYLVVGRALTGAENRSAAARALLAEALAA